MQWAERRAPGAVSPSSTPRRPLPRPRTLYTEIRLTTRGWFERAIRRGAEVLHVVLLLVFAVPLTLASATGHRESQTAPEFPARPTRPPPRVPSRATPAGSLTASLGISVRLPHEIDGHMRSCTGGMMGCPLSTMLCVGAHHRMLCEVQRRHPAVNITGTADDHARVGDDATHLQTHQGERLLAAPAQVRGRQPLETSGEGVI